MSLAEVHGVKWERGDLDVLIAREGEEGEDNGHSHERGFDNSVAVLLGAELFEVQLADDEAVAQPGVENDATIFDVSLSEFSQDGFMGRVVGHFGVIGRAIVLVSAH